MTPTEKAAKVTTNGNGNDDANIDAPTPRRGPGRPRKNPNGPAPIRRSPAEQLRFLLFRSQAQGIIEANNDLREILRAVRENVMKIPDDMQAITLLSELSTVRAAMADVIDAARNLTLAKGGN